MGITNSNSGTRIDEIADRIYRISTPVPPSDFPGGFTFNRHATDGECFRARDVETGNRDEIELSYRKPSSCPESK